MKHLVLLILVVAIGEGTYASVSTGAKSSAKSLRQERGATYSVNLRGVEVGTILDRQSYWSWTNAVSLTLTVTGPTGPISLHNDACSGTQSGSGTCYFDIRFAPPAEGPYNGAITLHAVGTVNSGSGPVAYNETFVWETNGIGTVRPPKASVCADGSIINVTERTLGESIPLVGTDFKLFYNSGYAPEYLSRTYGFEKRNSFNREGWTISPQHLYARRQKRLFMGTGAVVYAEYSPYGANDLVVSPDGTEIYIFDINGKHLQTLTALTGAGKYVFLYDVNDRLITIKDAFDNQTALTRNANGRITRIQAPRGQITTFVRNTPGLFAKVTNPNGEAYEMTYANSETSGLLQTFKKPNGQISTFTYDSLGRLIKDLGNGGDFWNLLSLTSGDGVTKTSNMNRQSTYANTYSGATFISRVETDPAGVVVTYSEPTATSSRTSSAIEQVTNDTTSDGRFGAAFLRPSSYKYKIGTVESITTYGQTVSTSVPTNLFGFDSITETSTTSGRVTTSVYNAGTMTRTTTTPEGRTRSLKININEQPVETRIGVDSPKTYSYDLYGRLSRVYQGAYYNALMYSYNSSGYLETVTNGRSEVTTYAYDLAGRVAGVTLPDGRQVQYSYDANGNLSGVTPPSRPAHSFLRNAMDLISNYLPPALTGVSPKNTDYSYNLDRQLTAVSRPDGKTINYVYDLSTGQLTDINASDIGTSKYFYSLSTGLVSSAYTPYAVKNIYEYRGSMQSSEEVIRQPDEVSLGKVSYGYDVDHRVTSRTVRGGTLTTPQTISITLNGDNMPTQVGDMALIYSYPSGRLAATNLGEVSDSYSYDSLGNLQSYKATYNPTSGSPADLYEYILTRDGMSRIVTKSETVLGVTDVYNYKYDVAGRLTEVVKNYATETTAVYDSNSNRTSGTTDGIAFTANFDAQDRMTTFKGRTYSYNNNGDLSSIQWSATPSDVTSFTYDSSGNLNQVVLPSAISLGYGVDIKSNRAYKKTGSTVSQRFIYEPNGRLAAEVNESGIIQKQYVSATGLTPDYLIHGGVNHRIIKDHLGSPRLVVNASTGGVVQRIDYGSYGAVLTDTNPGFQPFGFAGGLYDHQTKLVRFGARDYDPEIGRWTSKDPILFNGGDVNLYGYVENDPVNWVDSDGLTKGRPGQVLSNDPLAGGGGGPPASAPVGRIGSMDMTPTRGTNCPTNISGRNYSGHALDRMQGRGITPSVVENTIANGVPSMQNGGAIKLFDINNNVSVIINSKGNVITVFPGN